jgi:beta-mannosidase
MSYANLPGAPFVSEFGAAALPNLEMMKMIFIPAELTYQSGEIRDRWEYHGFQPRQSFDLAEVEQGDSLEEFIANSQTYQANLLKFAIESYRRAKYNPMQGIFQFMFVDHWPAIGYSIMDYDRQPKAGYYALQTAMQPILPSIVAPLPPPLTSPSQNGGGTGVWRYPAETNPSFQLWVINDTLQDYPTATLAWKLLSGETEIAGRDMSIHIDPDSTVQKTLVRDLNLSAGVYRLAVELFDAAGQSLGVNEFEFEILSGG